VRSISERWRAVAPDSRDAALALGKAALAQKDLSRAEPLLEPLARRAEATPAELAAYVEAMTEKLWAERSVFNPVPADLAAEIARRARADKSSDPALRRAADKLCEALPKEQCQSAAPVARDRPDRRQVA